MIVFIFLCSVLTFYPLLADDLSNTLEELASSLQLLEKELHKTSYEQPLQSTIIEFDKPTRITCGPRYRSDGKIILKRGKSDNLRCVIQEYADFYFERWHPEDKEFLSELYTQDVAKEFFGAIVMKPESQVSHRQQVIVSVTTTVPKYVIIWPKNRPDIKEKIKTLLYALETERPISKYLIQTLLGYKQDDIARYYEINYQNWRKKFQQDQNLARTLINESKKVKLQSNTWQLKPIDLQQQTYESCTLW